MSPRGRCAAPSRAQTGSTSAVAPANQARRDQAGDSIASHDDAASGGSGNSSGALTTVEAYDVPTNAWTTVAPLPTARASLAAALGPDGRVYAIGGSGNSSGAPTTVEAYTA